MGFSNTYLHMCLYNNMTSILIPHFWNIGFLLGSTLAIQLLSGIYIAFLIIFDQHVFYIVNFLFLRIKHLWLPQALHASLIHLIVFLLIVHISRTIIYKNYINSGIFIWLTGTFIYLLILLEAFIGYVLPWGEMSFWGITVITNTLSIIPQISFQLLLWIWSNFVVSPIIITKCFVLHFVIGFIILLFIVIHIIVLHAHLSSEPIKLNNLLNVTGLFPLFILKDLFHLNGAYIYICNQILLPIYYDVHISNFNMVNILKTPQHIVPEWYLISFYLILKLFSNKRAGILYTLFFVLDKLFICILTNPQKSNFFSSTHNIFANILLILIEITSMFGVKHITIMHTTSLLLLLNSMYI